MEKNKLYEKIKESADNMSSDTLSRLIVTDQKYSEDLEKLIIAEERYKQLKVNSSEECVIRNFVEMSESILLNYATLSYLAGLNDGVKMLDVLEWNKDGRGETVR